MIIQKELLRKLIMILFGINSFLHISSIIISSIQNFLYIQNNFYYGIFVISLSLGVYYTMCIFFIKDEIFILEIIVILIFSILYTIFYIIPLGFITQSWTNYSLCSKLLVITFTFKSVNQIILLVLIFTHIAYFINMDDVNICSNPNKLEIKQNQEIEKEMNTNKDYKEYNDESDKKIENLDQQ